MNPPRHPPGPGKGAADEDGSALVEFVVMVCVLLLPVVYLVLVLGRVQAAAFATGSAARSAAVVIAGAPDAATADRRSAAVVRTALADQGFPAAGDPSARIRLACSRSGCQEPQSVVQVTVTQDVPLPVPRMLATAWPLHVTISATETAVSDRFRE